MPQKPTTPVSGVRADYFMIDDPIARIDDRTIPEDYRSKIDTVIEIAGRATPESAIQLLRTPILDEKPKLYANRAERRRALRGGKRRR